MRLRVALAALALPMLLAAPARAGTTWVIEGAGFGHGVGMSAYGALGFGKKGAGYRAILGHYFRDLKLDRAKGSPRVRVLLAVDDGEVAFSHATRACGRRLRPTRTPRAVPAGSGVALHASGKRLAGCGKRLRAEGRGSVAVRGLGTYRGSLNVIAGSGGALNVVNDVGINAYAQGVLPVELFPSWPRETLKAFAVAARSIALATDVGGEGWDIYADTRTQVYEGKGVETKRTNAAVQATRDLVAKYRGRVVQTFYHSSSGGRTESRFLGGPRVGYLRSVRDPLDRLSPLHRWTFRFSQAEMDTLLGNYVRGRLRRVVVLRRGDSPRIELAKLVGTRGSSRVRGDTLQVALGLPDRWATFRRR